MNSKGNNTMNNATKTTYRLFSYLYGRENNSEAFATVAEAVAEQVASEKAEEAALDAGEYDATMAADAGLRFEVWSFTAGIATKVA